MNKVKVFIVDKQSVVKIPTGIRLIIRKCCNAVLDNEGFYNDAEVSVSFVDNEEIKKLNGTYRNKAVETDVISFPLGEKGAFDKNVETGFYMLGDIVISVQKAAEQAKMLGHTLQREIGFLTVHSMLHLLGYDHEKSGEDALIMREKEEGILAKLDLARVDCKVDYE